MEPVILILPSQSICIHHILYTSGLQDSDSLCSKAWIRMTASKLHKKQVNKGRFHILSPTSSHNFCVRRRGKPPRKIRRRGKPPMLAAARDLYWVSAGLVCLIPPPPAKWSTSCHCLQYSQRNIPNAQIPGDGCKVQWNLGL